MSSNNHKFLRFLEGFIYSGLIILILILVAQVAIMVGDMISYVFSVDPLMSSIFFVFCLSVGFWNAACGGKS